MSPSPKDSLTVTALVKSNGAITVLGVEDVAAREVDTPSVLSGTFLVVDKAVDAPDVREIVGVLPLARDTPLYEGETKRDIRFEARVYLENGDEKRMDVDAQIVRFTLAGIRKETYANQDLKLSLRQIPDTHRGQLLDIPIATALSTTKVKTDGIPLEQPLNKFYRRR